MTEPPKHVRSLSTSTVIYKPAPSPKPAVGTSARRSVSASARPKLNVSPESKLAPRSPNNGGRSATPAFKEKGSFEFAQPTNRFPAKAAANTSPPTPSLKPPKPDRATKVAAAEKARSLLHVDWALLDSKMPTGKDSDSAKRRRILFKQFDMIGDGRITLASTHKTITSVLNMWNMFPPQVVQLAHQAAAAYTGDGPPPKFSKKVTVGEYVDWNKFRMLLVYLRQHLELWVMFDALNTARDGHLTEAEFVANFELLVQYGFDFPDPVKSFHEMKMSKNGGVLFKDFAHWGLTKKLHVENTRGDVSEPTSPTHRAGEEFKFPREEKKVLEEKKPADKAEEKMKAEPTKSMQSPELTPSSRLSERGHATRSPEQAILSRSPEHSQPSENSRPENPHHPEDSRPANSPRLSENGNPRMSENGNTPRLSENGTSKLLLANSPPLTASPRLSHPTPQVIPEIRITPPAIAPMAKPQAPPRPPALPPRGQITPPNPAPTPAPTSAPSPAPKPAPANANPDYVEEGEAEGDEEEEEEEEDDEDGAEEAEVAQDQRDARKAVEEELAGVRSTEAERLAEYELLEFVVVRAPETKVVKGVVRDFVARKLGRGCLCFTATLDYMENCMYEAEEAELEEEARARQAELESSEEDDDDCDPFFPSWLETHEGEYNSDNDGQFMEQVQEAECEVCEDKHPANVRCLECEENMCEKLGLAHKKSKIGKDHTMTSPKFEPQPIEPHRKTSAEESLERAAAEKISAFKTMMDAKVKILRLGKPAVPAGERLRAGVRSWGKATLVKCELCEEQHPATFLCVDCGQNMCDKLTAVHAKSKIGRDHELKPL